MILLQLYMVYVPAFRRRRKARQMAEKKGEYLVEILKDTILYGKRQELADLTGGMAVLFCSARVYTIKTDRQIFTIPKRVLSKEEDEKLNHLMERNGKRILVELRKE